MPSVMESLPVCLERFVHLFCGQTCENVSRSSVGRLIAWCTTTQHERKPQPKTEVGLISQKMCKYFHLQAAYGGSFNMYATETIFCFKFELGAAMLVCSLPMKIRQKVGSLCNGHFCPTVWSCSCHRDRLPVRKWQPSQLCFCHLQTLIFNKLDHKSTFKL